VAKDEPPNEGTEESKLGPSLEQGESLAEMRARVPAAIRDVDFPSAGRGYERRAVDSYVNQVNRLIAELEVGRSPQAAVRHALDRVGEQTKGLLEEARAAAEKITAGAREEAKDEIASARAEAEQIVAKANAAAAEAEEIIAKSRADAADIIADARAEADEIAARAKAESENVLTRTRVEAAERLQRLEEEIAASREQAEARMQELHAETEAVWKERHELLEEMHMMGTRLLEVASAAAARASSSEGPQEPSPEGATGSETESAEA
jgi:cell division septum initiation protein DivIVA